MRARCASFCVCSMACDLTRKGEQSSDSVWLLAALNGNVVIRFEGVICHCFR